MDNLKIKDPKITKYIDLIHKQNGKAYVVGGYVRDFLLNRNSYDIDIEVYNLSFNKLKKIFDNDIQIYSNFGVINILNTNAEFTIPRYENKIGIKHNDFDINLNPNMSLKEAAKRRDFTINTIMYDLSDNKIIDNYNGIEHLENKKIVHVSEKFEEDPLRVLRAIRFSFVLGFDIDKKTLNKCINLTKELKYISSSRKEEEYKKAFNTNNQNFIVGMKYFKKLFFYEYEIYNIDNQMYNNIKSIMIKHNKTIRKYNPKDYYLIMWAIFLIKTEDNIELLKKEQVIKDVFSSKKEQKRILKLITNYNEFKNTNNIKTLYKIFTNLKTNSYLLIKLNNILDEKNNKLEIIYKKYIKYKEKYNGKYFIDKGYKNIEIKKLQENKIVDQLKKDFKNLD